LRAELRLRRPDTGEQLTISPDRLVVAAFTGRDQEQVERHIDELARQGVPRPARVPDFYSLPVDLLTTAQEISVEGGETSGEAEPVLYLTSGDWFVGAGSDHTARDLEREDIPLSKEACAKVVSREVLPYEALEQCWDQLVLRSWAGERPYQEASLSELMPVPEIMRRLSEASPNGGGDAVVFLGTVPLATESFVFSDQFRVELRTPEGDTAMGLSYRVLSKGGAR
jgi:uncharacterized protein DUF2848